MKKIFLEGPHNLIVVVAIIAPIFFFARFWLFKGHFFIVAVEKTCQQPLNNRCSNFYHLKDFEGHQATTSLGGYIFRDAELAVGNKIEKAKFRFNYLANDEGKSWAYWGGSLTSLLAGLSGIFMWRWYVVLRQ